MTVAQRFRRKLVRILDLLRNRLENENNSDMLTNGEARFLQALRRWYGDRKICLLDVGSASGEYSSYLPGATVYSFDGRQNYLVSDADGVRTFYVRTHAPELSSVNRLTYLDAKYGPVQEMQMRTRSLKSIIEEEGISHVSVLKIDTEGHEMHVLKGLGEYLNSDFIDFVQFEHGNAEADARLKTFYELFEEKGFRVAKIYRHSVDSVPYMSQNENLNYANYVAISGKISFIYS